MKWKNNLLYDYGGCIVNRTEMNADVRLMPAAPDQLELGSTEPVNCYDRKGLNRTERVNIIMIINKIVQTVIMFKKYFNGNLYSGQFL